MTIDLKPSKSLVESVVVEKSPATKETVESSSKTPSSLHNSETLVSEKVTTVVKKGKRAHASQYSHVKSKVREFSRTPAK